MLMETDVLKAHLEVSLQEKLMETAKNNTKQNILNLATHVFTHTRGHFTLNLRWKHFFGICSDVAFASLKKQRKIYSQYGRAEL